MFISDLALSNFRSYENLLVHFEPGVTALIGENGQGKTNIVEAINYLATLSSHRVSSDSAMIRQGSNAAVIRARVIHDVPGTPDARQGVGQASSGVEGTSGAKPAGANSSAAQATTLDVEIYAGHANRARINRGAVRPPEILGIVRSVLFSPDDLDLVRGDPQVRRSFLDSVMVQLHPRLASIASDYHKISVQRAALLKKLRAAQHAGRHVDLDALDAFSEPLVNLGSELTAARAQIISGLRPFVADFYARLTPHPAAARLAYRASVDASGVDLPRGEDFALHPESAEASLLHHDSVLQDVQAVRAQFRNLIEMRQKEEIDRGINLVGPHRDDMVLWLDSLPARGYASHGESWSFALALRMASWELLRTDESGMWAGEDEPILILDDVFAELDSRRRSRLADIVQHATQVFITAAVGDDVPDSLAAHTFTVHQSVVHRGSPTDVDTGATTESTTDESDVAATEAEAAASDALRDAQRASHEQNR
ncbi:MAG: DNA replication/repair protein RecF [Actinomycetaceae bacterium]|nr:DNA replication/repair protein RecF [Actinomycetaceae bacterium]